MQYQAYLVDDEPKIREVLRAKIEQLCPQIDIRGVFGNIDQAYAAIQEECPRLLFLDISMPGGSGFDLLDRFPELPFEVIFITGFNNYILDALKVSAVDYLLKPISNDDLINAVEKAVIRMEDRKKIEMYEVLRHNLKHIGDQETRIAIPGTTAYDFTKVSDIIRCEGWQKYTKIHLLNGTVLTSSYNLGVFKSMLLKYDFFDCHKSHLINIHHIVQYQKEGVIKMVDDSSVPVSRRKRDDFQRQVVNRNSL